MPRPLRIQFPGATYHLIIRSQDELKLFRDDPDRQTFCDRLRNATHLFSLELHAYCLMPNHVHLFLSTPQANLSRAMQWLGTTYTARFNRRHERHGHLFQGRYKARLVENDSYFASLSRYIHLNPVKAGLARRPEDFPWSSYRGYCNKKFALPFVNYNTTLKTMSESDPNIIGRFLYRKFVTQQLAQLSGSGTDFELVARGSILGSDTFRQQIKKLAQLSGSGTKSELVQTATCFTIDDIIKAVAAESKMTPDSLQKPSHGRKSHPRSVAIYLCRHLTKCPYRHIAPAFGIKSCSAVAKHCRNVKPDDNLLQRARSRLQNNFPN